MSNSATSSTSALSRRVGLGKVEIAHAPAQLTAILGSCVGIAFYDSQTATGTLAHVVVPEGNSRACVEADHARRAIKESLTMLEQAGCNLDNVIAKMAGGAKLFGNNKVRERGHEHLTAVCRAVEDANVELNGEDLGGSKGRRVTLDAQTGDLLIETPGEGSMTL